MTQETTSPQSPPQPERDAMMAAQAEGRTLDSQYDDDDTAGLDEKVEANRGHEQGLGMGAGEPNAQGDPGLRAAADEDEVEDLDETDEADDADEVEPLDRDAAVQGDDADVGETGAGV